MSILLLDVLGQRLKQWRTASGLNQDQVADTLGVTQSTISASERGQMSAPLLVRLVALYKPPADELRQALAEYPGDEASAS